MTPHPEIGRELKVSELVPRTVYVVWKEGRPAGTLWFLKAGPKYAHFLAGEVGLKFAAIRTGPDLEQITDDDGLEMKIFEYLGKV